MYVEGDDSPPPMHSGETPPAVLHPALGQQHKRDVELLEQVQRRPRRCWKGWSSSALEPG